MTGLQRVWDLAGTLAHRRATGPFEATRHRYFIAGKLVHCVLALAAAPLYLAAHGAPSAFATLALAFALAPAAAVFVVSRTGDLVAASTISMLGLVGFALALVFADAALAPAAMGWLILAPLDVAMAFSAPLLLAAGAVALVAVGVCAYVASVAAAPAAGLATAVFAIAALMYALATIVATLRLYDLRSALSGAGVARYDAVTHALDDLVVFVDRGGAVLQADARADQFGLSHRDLMARGLFERIHVGDRPGYLKAVSDAAADGALAVAEVRLRAGGDIARDGAGFVWASIRARRVEGEGPVCVALVLGDLQREKEHARELESARVAAERTSHWKDRFLANVSHELRTPLNAIIGFSEILGSPELAPADPARAREYADIINTSGQHLLQVVNSILDISKIEAGRFDLLPEPFELGGLVDQCCDMVRLKAQEAAVTVERDVPAAMAEVVADKRALKQILINLVSNAVKFTPANGRVLIAARPEGASIAISITDTGIGVIPADLARLGDPFFQARDSYDRPYEGTGLGLSVVRGLVGLHGGAITIESAPGEGTRVTVKIPADCRLAPEATRAGPAPIETIARGPASLPTPDFQDRRIKRIA